MQTQLGSNWKTSSSSFLMSSSRMSSLSVRGEMLWTPLWVSNIASVHESRGNKGWHIQNQRRLRSLLLVVESDRDSPELEIKVESN
jgi:hypothetical protein